MDTHYETLRRMFEHKMAVTDKPWLVLEGDWGGQVYLTIPWNLVRPFAEITGLLKEMDGIAWPGDENRGASAHLYLPSEHGRTSDAGVSGGMGGGILTDDLWLHNEFDETMRNRARELLCPKA